MNTRFIVSVIAAFAVIFGFQYVYHGVLLMPTYEATASVWRPMTEMQQMMPWCIGAKLALAIAFTWIFSKHYEGRGVGEGVRFGLYTGMLLGISTFMSYIHLPISLGLAAAWFVGEVAMAVLVGITLSYTYRAKGAA